MKRKEVTKARGKKWKVLEEEGMGKREEMCTSDVGSCAELSKVSYRDILAREPFGGIEFPLHSPLLKYRASSLFCSRCSPSNYVHRDFFCHPPFTPVKSQRDSHSVQKIQAFFRSYNREKKNAQNHRKAVKIHRFTRKTDRWRSAIRSSQLRQSFLDCFAGLASRPSKG